MTRSRTLALALVLPALALAACGDDSSSTPPPAQATTTAAPAVEPQTPKPAGPTRTEFLRELNALCDSTNKRLRPLREEGDPALRRIADLFADAAQRIESIEPASAESDAFAKYAAALQRSAGLLERAADAQDEGDVAGARRFLAADRREGQARLDAALDIGAERCGR